MYGNEQNRRRPMPILPRVKLADTGLPLQVRLNTRRTDSVSGNRLPDQSEEESQMSMVANMTRKLLPASAVLLSALIAGCGGGGGGQDTLLGTAPTVTATSPRAATPIPTGIAINTRISATFSRDMAAGTITGASFTLACPASTAIAGTVSYVAASRVATFRPAANLPINTTCTASVTTGAQDTAGTPLGSAFTWRFTTGATTDTTRPTVSTTIPATAAVGVATNTKVLATFSEDMDAATIGGTSFTLTGPGATPVAGTVSYSTASRTASFSPTGVLATNTVFTATVTTATSDMAGNTLAANKVWTFTTGATSDTTTPSVNSTNPLDAAIGVCTNKTVNATFSESMDPLTISTATFTLSVTSGAAVTGLVSYDASTNIASFNPVANLTGTPATSYTATIMGGVTGVKDLAGNPMASDKIITFTTNASTCATALALGAAAPFGGFGGNATLTNDGLGSTINGDIGVNAASTTITGLRDSGGNVYTVTPNNDGTVTGLVYTLTAPPGSVAGAAVTQARADALTAFNSISPASLPGGLDVSSLAQCPSCGGISGGADDLGGRTLPPGVYLSTTGTYSLGKLGYTVANLTLDAGGDANAVWVFQTAAVTGTLTVGLTGPATPATPIKVLLVNGAQSKNIFWYVPAGATIGTGSTMEGTLLGNAAITMSTTGGGPPPNAVTTTLNGRAIALTAGVTMTNSVINVPAP